MRYIGSFILLLCFLCLRANAQGLEFNTYESETIQKTSYSVFDENPLTFKGHFSISYDLAIQDYGSFGYIFRLKDLKRENADIYSFVFSYDNDERSYLKFNIEAKECLIVDTLCNKKLGPRRWIPIEISFFLKEDSVCLTIDKRQYQSGKLGLSGELTPTIMFGSSKFSEEIPSFAIRNLVISDMNQQINFPLNESSGILIDLKEDEKEVLCKAAQGLTLQEAENAFARAMVSKGQLTIKELDVILDEKCQVIKKTGILEFIKSDFNMNDVGGLENLKKWLIKRNNSWLGKAQKDYNLPAPKGVLITGVPGCGKSLTAKAMSALWQLPLLRLDVGKIFSGLVGSSEENMRKAIQTAEAVAPSILWIDEIEKGFGGNGGERDGGTATRVFGTFLTWMSEKTKPVFVIATANNINALPSEMLRKGRFDEIFFVDLPTKAERKVIFKLHLEKRLKGSISKDFAVTDTLLNKLAEITEGFVGAEIEQVVISALFEAFSENRTLNEEHLYKVIKNTVPLSTTQSEQILAIREWANERAVAATAHDESYNYVPEETQEQIERKKKEKKSTETVKKARGGRTIDF